MKYMPHYMSFLGFLLTLLFFLLLGKAFNVEWFMFYSVQKVQSDGVIFEAVISWIPIIIAFIISYFSWRIGKKKFHNKTLDT
jgi:uncharacterized membrane protein